MKCPFCAHLDTKVTDSRVSTASDVVRRRRACEACERRFTTYERVEELMPLVVKKDGRREPFERDKIVQGVRRACEKLAIPSEVLEQLVGAIENELSATAEREVSARAIGEKVSARLRDLHPIAYVRFASVYRSFKDLHELREELDNLARAERGASAVTSTTATEGAHDERGPRVQTEQKAAQ